MFAYCRNNPAMRKDASGSYDMSFSIFNEDSNPFNDLMSPSGVGGGVGGGGGVPTRETSSKGIRDEISDFVNNTSEEAVLGAEYFAFYKGALVIKIKEMGTSAFSFGIIFMGSNVSNPELVKHERGHVDQLLELGVVDYSLFVALPSITGYWAAQSDPRINPIYHSLPWEYVANVYGNASFKFAGWAAPVASVYWECVKIMSFLTP